MSKMSAYIIMKEQKTPVALESLVDVGQSKHELSAQGELKVSELPLTPPKTVFMDLGDILCCGK